MQLVPQGSAIHCITSDAIFSLSKFVVLVSGYVYLLISLPSQLNATQPEKDYLIAEGKLGSHLRTRSVTLITTRSAYKLHGSKMIIGA